MSSWHIKLARRCVAGGGVIAYPTESVYGLGCSPWEIKAIQRILSLKRRRPDKGLIVVAATFEQLEPLLELTHAIPLDTVFATWPGPVTWIFPVKAGVSSWLAGTRGGIAVRVSAHPLVRELCLAAGPLVSTSANPEGYPPARNPARVRAYFADRLDYILAGATGGAPGPSEIRHALTGRLIRPSAA